MELHTVNSARLLESFSQSSNIGRTENNGLNRLTLTEEDKAMRDLFVRWLKEENLTVRIDDFGNIYGRREGKLKDAAPIVFGSHLDTQPCGGRFDGILGVLGGLEVIRTLNELKIETDYPLEIINFTNEEGARFNPPMLGSGGLANVFSREYIYSVNDHEGISFEEALIGIDYKGIEENRLKEATAYVELHIEQGPILDYENIDVGVVHGIQGLTRMFVTIIGKTNHAGGARMQDRNDSMRSAAEMITAIYNLTNDIEDLRITIGKIENYPNVINVISGQVDFVVDIRHEVDDERRKTIPLIEEKIRGIAEIHGVKYETTLDWSYDTVPFDKAICTVVDEVASRLDYSTLKIFSGPGHDSKYMAEICSTAMIFVKSVDGLSHNEQELTHDEDLIKGTNVLLNTILKLASFKKTQKSD